MQQDRGPDAAAHANPAQHQPGQQHDPEREGEGAEGDQHAYLAGQQALR